MHFVGVLFGGNEGWLDDYWEGLEVEPYIYQTKQEIIGDYISIRKSNIKWHKEQMKKNPSEASIHQQWLDENKPFTKKTAWEKIQIDYEGSLDDAGNVLTTANPNATWDWYVVGGRWDNYFPLKEKTSEGSTQYANEATIEEVDWETYFNTKRSPYCYITPTGEWFQDNADSRQFFDKSSPGWDANFKRVVSHYSGDTLVKVIDFHI